MVVKKDPLRYTWHNCVDRQSASGRAVGKRLADARADGVPSAVEVVRFNNGEEFYGERIWGRVHAILY